MKIKKDYRFSKKLFFYLKDDDFSYSWSLSSLEPGKPTIFLNRKYFIIFCTNWILHEDGEKIKEKRISNFRYKEYFNFRKLNMFFQKLLNLMK